MADVRDDILGMMQVHGLGNDPAAQMFRFSQVIDQRSRQQKAAAQADGKVGGVDTADDSGASAAAENKSGDLQ